jgi:hypothetical protein
VACDGARTAHPDTKPSLEVLLQFKANINARDSFFRFAPLTWAVAQCRLNMVQFLLDHGAAIELPDDPFWTTPRFWPSSLPSAASGQPVAVSDGTKPLLARCLALNWAVAGTMPSYQKYCGDRWLGDRI